MNKKNYPVLMLFGLIMALVITGCTQKPKTFNERSINDSDILSEKKKVIQSEQDKKSVVIDCGQAEPPKFFPEGEIKADESTISAWECFVDNIESCTPAKIKSMLGAESIEYKIIGRKNNICQIMGPMVNFQTGKSEIITCDFTEELIQYGFNQSETMYPGKKFMKGPTLMGYITGGCKGAPDIPAEAGQKKVKSISKTSEQLCEETGGTWKEFNTTAEDCAKITDARDCLNIEGCTWKMTKQDLPDGGINIIRKCIPRNDYCDCPSKHWRGKVGCMPK